MSEKATLDEFARGKRSGEQRQKWKKVKLHEIAYKRSDNVDPQEVELEKHVGLEHIDPNNPVPNWESLDDLSSTKRRFEAGDILFAKLRPNLEKSAQPEFEGVASTDIFPIVAGSNVNSKWLLYRLSSKPAYDYARRTSAGTRMPRTSWNLFSNFSFDLPPLPEQRKIASVLYTVDRAIQKTEEVIRTLQRILRGTRRDVMKNGIRTHQMSGSDSRFGDVPEAWDVDRLGSVTDVTGGSTPSTDEPEYWDGEIPWATPTDLTGSDEVTISTTESYITDEGLNSSSTNLLPRQSVLMTSRATIGECAINTVEMATNQGFQSLVPLDGIDTWYLYYRMEEEANYLNSLGSGSTFSEVSNTTVQRVKIPIPPVDEQKEIANVLRSIDETIIKEKEYKSQLQRFKRGLMQDLLSGTVRTTDNNIEVPDEIAQYG